MEEKTTWKIGKSKYKNPGFFKTLSAHSKRLNKLILEGSDGERIAALKELNKLVRPHTDLKAICVARTVKKRYPAKYTYIPAYADIQDNDICAIYKIQEWGYNDEEDENAAYEDECNDEYNQEK